MSFTEVLDTIATFIGGIYKPTLFISLLVANFTSRIPNMGGCVAHVKSCELLEILHATNYGQSAAKL